MTKKILWIVVNTCRLLVSATFIFSGLVKLLDPAGTSYKIVDYAAALGTNFLAQPPLPMTLAVAMALLEFTLGIYLFFGIRRRFTTYTILAFMLVYTPLTLWLAMTNAVADCGCFGDAIHLTNWQTFWKNVALLAAAIILFWRGNLLTRVISESTQWIISLYSLAYALFIAFLCIWAEPIIDFRPFHIGQNIPKAMEWPEDPSLQPEILDFDVDPTLIEDTGYVFILTSPHLETADDSNFEDINAIYDYSQQYGYRFVCLTPAEDATITRWQDLTGAQYPFDFADELTLKTIARNNPAITLLHNGTVVGKWGHRQLPKAEALNAPLHQLSLAHPHEASYRHLLLKLLLWYIVPLLTITFLDRAYASFRWWQRRKDKKEEGIIKNEESGLQNEE